jgi:hypothetical protein
MKNWFQNNLRNIIITAFVIPILLVAFVSISHVTTFYGLSNPITWAVYLSVGIEIAALSALAAVSVNMGRFVYVPFFIVTLIQMIGNIFFSFTYIDETGQSFQDWVNMVGGLFENMGIERTDLNTHKTILSFLSGGLLPIISLTFAHMLVKFSEQTPEEKENDVMSEEEFKKVLEERRKNEVNEKWTPTEEQLEIIEKILDGKYRGPEKNEIVEEPIRPTQEELDKLQEVLNNFQETNEILEEDVLVTEDSGYSFEDASEFIPMDDLNVETENSDVIEGVTASTLNPEIFDDNKTLRYTKLNKNV